MTRHSGACVAFVCGPSGAILDNWMPVLLRIRDLAPGAHFVMVVPRAVVLDDLDPAHVLFRLGGGIFSSVLFRSHGGRWVQAVTLEDAQRLNALDTLSATMMRIAYRIENRRIGRIVADGLRRMVSARQAGTPSAAVCVDETLRDVPAVLYDVVEARKPYMQDVMGALRGVPKFSICHGIDINDGGRIHA